MKGIYYIPPENNEALNQAIVDLDGYNKAVSILYLCSLGLPTLHGIIVTEEKELYKAYEYFAYHNYENVMIRTDRHQETGDSPRGGNLVKLSDLIEETKKFLIDKRIVILLVPRSRFNNLYNVNIIFEEQTTDILLEILGSGFDASDLNRGDISPHETIIVPNSGLIEQAKRRSLTNAQYQNSVKLRLQKIAKMLNAKGGRDSERIATQHLQNIGETLLLSQSNYIPLPENLLQKLLQHILPLPYAIQSRNWGTRPFIVSSSFFAPTGEFVVWDIVFPFKKYHIPKVAKPTKRGNKQFIPTVKDQKSRRSQSPEFLTTKNNSDVNKISPLSQLVYPFDDGNTNMRQLLGSKGSGLAEMTQLGLPVPPGFTITTQTYQIFSDNGNFLPQKVWQEILKHIHKLEVRTGKLFGSPNQPLVLSVRSGAPQSMPGMMDTVLNVGLNDLVIENLATSDKDVRNATLDAYCRLIQMYGKCVLGIDSQVFNSRLEEIAPTSKSNKKLPLPFEILTKLIASFKDIIKIESGREFPQDVVEQLRTSIEGVFSSWNNPRAVYYRKIAGIPDNLGTAVNVQMMVFGNLNKYSGTGVVFSRNPSSGEKDLFGEFILMAQGEDVVSGTVVPDSLTTLQLKFPFPKVFAELKTTAKLLEKHYTDMQEIEFTIEDGKLWILQTRSGKRTATATVKIAVDLALEKIISKSIAVQRASQKQLHEVLRSQFVESDKRKASDNGLLLTSGLSASPGVAVGKVVFDSSTAKEFAQKGDMVVLVRPATVPNDLPGMLQSSGVLTCQGGVTSHAAVVARNLGIPCITGCTDIEIDLKNRRFQIGNEVINEMDIISLDATTGEVFRGSLPIEPLSSELEKDIALLQNWSKDTI